MTATAAIIPVAQLALGAGFVGLVLIGLGIKRSGRDGLPVQTWKLVVLTLVAIAILWAVFDLVRRPRSETMTFVSGGTRLVGDVYLPATHCPCAAAVFVHGSGPGPAWMYAYYARQLAERGIIAFAYDKRGSGRSGGDLHDGGYELYARNVADAVAKLRSRSDVDQARIGLVAYSEGEWVAPIAAANAPVASVVVIGGSGLSPVGQGDEQAALRMRATGSSEQTVVQALSLSRDVRKYERTGTGKAALLPRLAAAQKEPWFKVADNLPSTEEIAPFKDYAWWRSYMDTDPAAIWARVKVPVLLVKGGRDDHSYGRLSLERMRAMIPVSRSIFVPDGNHIIMRFPLGGSVPPAVFANYFDDAARWIAGHSLAQIRH